MGLAYNRIFSESVARLPPEQTYIGAIEAAHNGYVPRSRRTGPSISDRQAIRVASSRCRKRQSAINVAATVDMDDFDAVGVIVDRIHHSVVAPTCRVQSCQFIMQLFAKPSRVTSKRAEHELNAGSSDLLRKPPQVTAGTGSDGNGVRSAHTIGYRALISSLSTNRPAAASA